MYVIDRHGRSTSYSDPPIRGFLVFARVIAYLKLRSLPAWSLAISRDRNGLTFCHLLELKITDDALLKPRGDAGYLERELLYPHGKGLTETIFNTKSCTLSMYSAKEALSSYK